MNTEVNIELRVGDKVVYCNPRKTVGTVPVRTLIRVRG